MKINFLQIYDFDLDLSKRLNETIEYLPNEWICLTDGDTLKFPSFAPNLKEIIKGINETDLLGCMVNRLSPNNPAVVLDLYEEKNMDVHFNKAVELWDAHGVDTFETKIIAGSCMVFHKSLWQSIGGFDESKLFFDKYFSYSVTANGGKCLIAKGLYIFHLYRWGSVSPRDSVEHLLKK